MRAVDQLLAKVRDLSGLIVYNERALSLVLDRLNGLGLRVPQDASVAAICPDDEAERLRPPATCASLPGEELARTACPAARFYAGQRGNRSVDDDLAANTENPRHHRAGSGRAPPPPVGRPPSR